MYKKEVYYVHPQAVSEDTLSVTKEEAHHLTRVLRKRQGDLFTAVDGAGAAFDCQIDSVATGQVNAKILKKYRWLGEPAFQLTLAVAIPKRVLFEWIVEKGTELGVMRFVPLLTERTIVTASSFKSQRLKTIAMNAMKQSRRCFLPEISSPQNYESVCHEEGAYHVRLLAHEKEAGYNLTDCLSNRSGDPITSAILCIGPEGGFTEEEILKAREANFLTFGMGPRRLKTETAAILAAGLLFDRMGELG